jgi:hypothetical protein
MLVSRKDDEVVTRCAEAGCRDGDIKNGNGCGGGELVGCEIV